MDNFIENIDLNNVCRITTRGLECDLDSEQEIFKEFHIVVSENEFHSICNSGTSCRLEEGSSNIVKIINYAEYIMPETGSCGMLIFVIMGAILLITPVIYIGYGFFQDKKFDLAS